MTPSKGEIFVLISPGNGVLFMRETELKEALREAMIQNVNNSDVDEQTRQAIKAIESGQIRIAKVHTTSDGKTWCDFEPGPNIASIGDALRTLEEHTE